MKKLYLKNIQVDSNSGLVLLKLIVGLDHPINN